MDCLTRKLSCILNEANGRTAAVAAARSAAGSWQHVAWVVPAFYWYWRLSLPQSFLDKNARRTHPRVLVCSADSICDLAVARDVDNHRGTASLGVFHIYDRHCRRSDSGRT